MLSKRAAISVTNDLLTDRRVEKVCGFLKDREIEVLLIGREKKDSQGLSRPYETHRFSMFFHKGFLFYLEYQARLFFKLMSEKADFLVSNDLDTLLANYLVSRLRGIDLVYDSHELFTEVPELQGRPLVKKIWERIEGHILPTLSKTYTVNEKIADYYQKKYGIRMEVVRNLAPALQNKDPDRELAKKLNSGKKMLLLQGSGINQDRGAEEAVLMMQYLEGFLLFIIGSGDVMPDLKQLVRENHLQDKVRILPRMEHAALMEYTKVADLGLSLDKDSNLNYRFSLPNKLFDYIQCGLPVLCSKIPQVADIVKENNIGMVLENHDPEHMAKTVQSIFENPRLVMTWKKNLNEAAKKFCWENEIHILEKVYGSLIRA